jgi:transposase
MKDERGRKVNALSLARKLKAKEVGEWNVFLTDPDSQEQVRGRIVATRLPLPLARKAAERRVRKQAKKNKTKTPDPRSIESCKYVFVFTTLPRATLSKVKVLELYQHRWQVELAFKRLKQILEIGRVPHKNRARAYSWIMAKMVLALLLEKLHRNAMSLSPWGYELQEDEPTPEESRPAKEASNIR